jgi:hypothetical protein
LELWFKSYVHLKFHACFAMIWLYLLNHTSYDHDLGHFGNGRERFTTFMFNKISFWWCKIELKLVQNPSIFGKFKLWVTFYFGKFFTGPQILQCECLKCQMRLVWTWMKYF